MRRWYDSGPDRITLIDDNDDLPVICGRVQKDEGTAWAYPGFGMSRQIHSDDLDELISFVETTCDPDAIREDIEERDYPPLQKQLAKQARALMLLNQDEVRTTLMDLEHPFEWHAEKGLTMWDYVAYLLLKPGSATERGLKIIKQETGKTLPRQRRRR